MGKMYCFSALVRRYAAHCGAVEVLMESGGAWDALGEWVPATPVRRVITAALAPYSQRQVMQSGGALSQKDCRLFCLEDLGDNLAAIKLCAGGEVYSVKEAVGIGDYADTYEYALAWVERLSAADKKGGVGDAATAGNTGNIAGGA